jgi:phosphoglycolate phosphatase
MRTVLFDLDGTLMLTGGAGVRGMNRAGRELFGDHFTIDGVPIAGGLDPVIYREAATRCGIHDHAPLHEVFRDRYLATLAHELATHPEGTVCLPGVRALLDDMRRRSDVWIGMVTGNYRAAAPIKLRAGGLDPELFRIAAFGDEAPTRPDIVGLALQRHAAQTGRSADPREFVVVGDTPRDVECAHAHGIPCLAVATGMHSVDELIDAGADSVVASLADPAPLWALFGT